MGSPDVNESVFKKSLILLKNGNLGDMERFYNVLYDEVFGGVGAFLKNGDHLDFLYKKKLVSRCYEVDWCLPESIRKDLLLKFIQLHNLR